MDLSISMSIQSVYRGHEGIRVCSGLQILLFFINWQNKRLQFEEKVNVSFCV